MTPHVICPTCQGTAKRMPVLSTISAVDYYQCVECKAVALTPKDSQGPAVPFGLSPASSQQARL
jgi:hypothetical protein